MPTLSVDAQYIERSKLRAALDMSTFTLQRLADEKLPRNHWTHAFGEVDDCIRCIDCEVLYGGVQSGRECPAYRESVAFVDRWFCEGHPKRTGEPPLSDDWADELPSDFDPTPTFTWRPLTETERAISDWESEGGAAW